MKATLVRDVSENFQGSARLYKVDPPVAYGNNGRTTKYIVVSAADVPFSGPETYIFPANADGEVLDWLELDGSFRGGMDHELALAKAGYE